MLFLSAFIAVVSAIITALSNLSAGINLIWIIPLTFISTYLSLILLLCLIVVFFILIVDVNKPVSTNSKTFRFLIKLLLDVLVPLLRVKIHATGLDKIPSDSRFLLVSNHLHDFDPAVFMYCMPNSDLAFIGKKEIFSDMKFIAKAMHKLNGIPIDRENNRSAILTINAAAENIKNNTVSMAIFPEGYCSKTGELLPFRNGAFKIAKKAHCPIVVATLKNTKQIVKNMFRKTTHVQLDILEVIETQRVDEYSTAQLGDYIHTLMSNNLN